MRLFTRDPDRPHARRWLTGVTRALMAVTAVIGWGGIVQAQIVQSFNIRYQTNTKGDIALVGNTLSTCGNGCNTGSSATSNNNIPTAIVDVDSLGSNSSTADLNLPSGSSVLFAGLYWGSRTNTALSGSTTIRFRAPGASSYTTLTSDSLYITSVAVTPNGAGPTSTNPYGAFKDVTTIVQAAGNGTYRAGGIALNTANDSLGGFGGWSLVVVYGNPTGTLRNLTVFDGYARIDGTNPVSTTVSGFITPPTGAVNGRIGAIAYEGDGPITGDQMLFNGSALTDAATPANNFFNSGITDLGSNVTTKNPNYVNQLGFDIHRVAAPAGAIPNNATSASVQFTTSGDVYFPQVITTAIDAYLPDFSGITKTVTDVNGGTLNPGDILEYTITATNVGQDNAIQSVLADPIPANTTYLPGSLQIVSGANAGAKTDGAGDDQAEYVSGSNSVVFRLGTGANASTGGTLAPASSFTVRFRVTLNTGVPGGTTINNSATMSYRSAIDTSLSLSSAAAASSTVPIPAIDVVKSAGTPTAVSGTPNAFDVPFTVVVGNRNAAGTPALPNVQVNDYLRGTFATNTPTLAVSGLSATGANGATCTVNAAFNGNTDTRLLSGTNSLAPGQSCTITFTARVTYSSASNVVTTAQNNSAYASANGNGTNAGYTFPGGTPTPPTGPAGTIATDTSTNGSSLPATPNGDTASPTPVTFSLNPVLQGFKSVRLTTDADSSGTITPGDTLTWTVQYTNTGGSAATGVQIADTLPSGATITAAGAQTITVTGAGTSAAKNTAYTGSGANTALINPATGGTLGVGGVIRVDIPVTINAGFTGTLSNQAGATGANVTGIVSSDNVDSTTSGLPTGITVPSGSLPQTQGAGVDPTTVTVNAPPSRIDVVKSVGTPTRVDPRTFDVPYTVRVGVASGLTTRPNVQVSENLSLTFSSGNPTISVSGLSATGVGGATCTASLSFNGTSSFGLLSGSDSLAAGQSCTISFTARVTYPTPSAVPTGAQNNSVYASSTPSGPNTGHTFPGGTPTAPAGATATDTSTNSGSLPATGNGDTQSATPVTFGQIPLIGTAKAVVGAPQRQANGSYNVGYSVVVQNYGNVALSNASATDDLTATFPAPTTFSVSNVAGTGSNSSFNGSSDKNLLGSGVTLNPGESRTITFTVNIVPNNAFGPFDNSVTASGTPPTGPAVTDVSTSGSNPDPNGNGNPGDPGEDAPTRVSLTSNPQIGTAKAATASGVKADQSYDVTYTVVVKNLGDITLNNVQATDNLNATFPAPASFSVSSVSGSGANGAFNGTTNQNLLSGGVNLVPGESRTITLVVNVKPGASNFGPFDNTVKASGTPRPTPANPNPGPVTDDSVNGTNPDPNGNGRGDDDTSPTPVSFSPNAVIGTAKSATAPVLQADGSYLVTYTTVVRNYGNTVLNNVQATDNLSSTFAAPTTFSVTSVSGTGVSPDFNGSSNQNLLASGVTLNPGDSRTVTFTVRIVPNGAFGPFNNTVGASGTPPSGPAVTDQSNNGSNPNPSGDNNPNKPSENTPTPVTLNPNPVIGTAKAITAGPTLQGNGSYDISYSVVVRNYGNVALTNAQATDDLTQTFESPATFTVKSITGSGANAGFNGNANKNLLANGISLQPGESRTVQFTVNVVPNGNFGPFANTVTARGTAATGPATTVTDTSNSGTDPNPSGDNSPNKPSENSPTVTSLTPNPMVGTAKSASPAIRQANGSYNITYTMVVRNYGNTVLEGVQATDNLSITFPSPSTFTVSSVSGTDANPGFDGKTTATRNLLAPNVTLNPGESRTITFTVNVVPNGAFGPFDNTVIASGTQPRTTANPNPSPVSDVSEDGTNPDPNGNNDPTEPLENTPTRTTFNPNPVIGTAKAVSAAIRQANGSYNLTYTVVVQNYGNITLENVSATDNLGLTFPTPTTFSVSGVSGAGSNPGFNGSSDQNLLSNGVTLQPGESRTVTYTVNVVPNGAFGPFDNSVLASGSTPSGTPGGSQTVTDVSNSGTNPNPSGDNDPTQPSENNPTRTSLTPNPVIGAAKSVSAPALQPDGSYVVTYSVLVRNYGNIRLDNVSATDDLGATFAAPTTFTVTDVSGTSANQNFNGSSDQNLLVSGVSLEPGESRTVTFSVRITPNGNFGPFNNNVVAKGNPPGGVPVTDVSDNSNSGLDPDPNGNGDPTEPGENAPTPITLTPRPAIGTAKAVNTSAVQPDGSYNITYTVLVRNYGNVALNGVQATDDLSQTFPSPATFTVSSVTGTDANASFDGKANKNLLAAGVILQPGESRTITVVVKLQPGANNLGPFNNTVLASGTPPATTGNPSPSPVTDVSNNGSNPDPNGNNDPTEPGENKPTPVSLTPNPVIGTAKAAGPALPQPNGSYNVTYSVVVRNYGNVNLENVTATDDLSATFPAPTTFTVSSVSGTGSNAGFNGQTNKNLLSSGITLQPGESRTVTFTVNIVPNGVFGPFNNIVLASGTPPATPGNPTPTPVSDRSTNGNNPNPSGDNDPTQPSENVPTPISLTPRPVIGTAKAVAGAPTLNQDGSFAVRFVVVVRNYGNTVLNNVVATDDLRATFPNPTSFTVSSVTGADANAGFNGNADQNLLANGVSLGVGESRRIEFIVTVNPNGNYGPFNNTVLAQGSSPASPGNPSQTVSDRSNDDPSFNPNDPASNPNPDPNGNGDPTEIGENNPTPVPVNPIPLAKNNLKLEKTVSAPVAKVGEPLGYTLKATNTSPVAMPDLRIDDNLPYGLVYRPGSSLVNGTALEPTVTQTTDGKGRPIQRLSWAIPGVLAPGASATVQFAVNVTPVVPEGENIVNTAVATAFGGQVTSNTAAAAVKVSLGVFTSNTVIVGRVYFDMNDNNSYEAGVDTPLAGARVYLSDGRYAITDAQGRYSLPDVTPGLYAIRLDPLTAPYQAKPVPDDQGQRGTRYVRTPIGGGIDTEDFPLYPAKGAAVKARSTTVTRGNVTLVKSLQQGGAGYAVSITVTLSGPVSNLSITDPLPQGATRGEVTLTGPNGQVIRATVQDGKIQVPGVLEPGKYTIMYAIFTPLPPELVVTDPDINYDEVIR